MERTAADADRGASRSVGAAVHRGDNLLELPELMVVAETDTEWRALQMYVKLMGYGSVSLHITYDPDTKYKTLGGDNDGR